LHAACIARPSVICREFTINLISEWFVEAANHTCGNYDRGINEIELSGLTPVPSLKVQCNLKRWKVCVTMCRCTARQPASHMRRDWAHATALQPASRMRRLPAQDIMPQMLCR
jgi:hypothetical protein